MNEKSFDCYYGMYLHNRGVKSSIRGKDLIDAIKKSNQNAILVKVFDEDGTEYTVREHEEVSPDNYYDYYWVDGNGKILYDEKEDKWGDYLRREKAIKEEEEKFRNMKPIVNDDLKVRVLAYDNKLFFIPNDPFSEIGNHWFPVNDKGNLGSSVCYTNLNLGVSREAFELMRKVNRGSDGVGDIDWYKMDSGSYTFGWWGWLYRVMDPTDSVSARGFSVRERDCVIIENIITDEMINGYKKYKDCWKLPECVSDEAILKYNRLNKLKELEK